LARLLDTVRRELDSLCGALEQARHDCTGASKNDDLLKHIEDLEESLALVRAQQTDDGTRIPLEIVEAEVNGDHPVGGVCASLAWSAEILALHV